MDTALLKLAVYLGILVLLIQPTGFYIYRVFTYESCGLSIILQPIEEFIYRLSGVRAKENMTWKNYASALLLFNLIGIIVAYLIFRLQKYLPLNIQNSPSLTPIGAFNTAISFVTNTCWQAFAPENIGYLGKILIMTAQNFFSAATGLAVLMAFIRSLIKHNSETIGNFWVDLVRGILYVFLPLSFIIAVILVAQGVVQNFDHPVKIMPVDVAAFSQEQSLPMGPVASLVAIKQLGSNGGGFFNTNSAHPFENPTTTSNLVEMLAILLLPAALCYTFGLLVKRVTHGLILFFAMIVIFIPMSIGEIVSEQHVNPALTKLGIMASPLGNMEGKEMRFGVVESSVWAAATTATSNGSVNAALDSFMPLSGGISLLLIELGEVIFGGVGTGLCGMLFMVILTAFIASLMVGRTPTYLGKKIEPFEMKMVAIYILLPTVLILIMTAIACVTNMGKIAIANPGPHGLTEILYAFSSMANQNGSAFAGLDATQAFYAIGGGFVMLITRYAGIIAVLALAGSLVQKKKHPENLGTLETNTPIFLVLLICVILIIGALSFLPALVFGPIIEYLS